MGEFQMGQIGNEVHEILKNNVVSLDVWQQIISVAVTQLGFWYVPLFLVFAEQLRFCSPMKTLYTLPPLCHPFCEVKGNRENSVQEIPVQYMPDNCVCAPRR